MERQEAGEDTLYFASSGRLAFRTNKVCDNCQTRIMDRYFYHCAENCDIDFCEECHRKLQEVFKDFFASGDIIEEQEANRERQHNQVMWVIMVIDRVAAHVLRLSPASRRKLASEFAFEWPTPMFERFVRAVIDVVNAKVVHVQDVKDIQSDENFWGAIGLLQFLYASNALPCGIKRLDEHGARGPKLEYDSFILEGINKCEPISEWQRWREHPSAKVPQVLDIENFELTADFCSFLTHNNLVPVSFRRVCLLCDIWEQIHLEMGRVVPLSIEVRRGPAQLLQDVLTNFDGLSASQLRRPLRVTFEGEEGAGPGVTKEFFQVALRSFLDGTQMMLFKYNEEARTYWFYEDAQQRDAYRACGILLGQAVLNNVLVPNIFPRVLYEKLLYDLESPSSRPSCMEDLATVSKDNAIALQRVLDYEGEDIGKVFGDLDWVATGLPEDAKLTQETKESFVQAYIEWFFSARIYDQFGPLSEGFRAILGGSALLQSMVDAVQLEKIVCGGSVPVDIPAIRRGAAQEGWSRDEELDYLVAFWSCIEGFTESERVQFVVFVTASDRVPLRGWQDLQLTVQKNGVGDDRLPTAHTCFCQLLLPRYSSIEKLKTNLLLAIANSEGFGLR
jgi:ubiquitin-protein ligase E3 A